MSGGCYISQKTVNPDDMSAIDLRQARERDEREPDTGSAPSYFDDSDSALLPYRTRPDSSKPSHKVPMMITMQHDMTRSPTAMSQSARLLRLCAFISIELLWLGFALFSNFHVFVTDSDGVILHLPGGLTVTYDALFKSGLSMVGIVIQLIALLPVAEITVEIYSAEWAHVLVREDGQLTHVTDRVSTLTSTFRDRFAHLFDKRSSRRYRIMFTAALLSLLLQAIAPGALTVSSDTAHVDTNLTISALAAGQTDPTGPVHLDSTGFMVGDESKQTLLARKLVLEATRYEFVTWIENSTVDYHLESDTLLFGMPSRDLLTLDTHLEYESDGVHFQYKCQWLAPTYTSGNLSNSNWTFGGDMVGRLDYNAIPISADPKWVYGLWPLMVTSGSGASNGSFAWLFIGSGTEPDFDTSHMPIDLSSISSSERTYNATGWYDLANNTSADEPELYAYVSTDASVLFCDPHMELITVHVTLQDRLLLATMQQNRSIGNIDWGEASRMLGRSLNGMPWDTVQFDMPGLDLTAGLSQLAVNFALQQTHSSESDQTLPLTPLPLSNITDSLQSYIQIAGANAYLDGSVGSTRVPAQMLRAIQRLVCSWPQWGASAALLIVIAFLLGSVIIMEGSGESVLVPLTLASVAAALESEKPDVLQESPVRESFVSKLSYEKYTSK